LKNAASKDSQLPKLPPRPVLTSDPSRHKHIDEVASQRQSVGPPPRDALSPASANIPSGAMTDSSDSSASSIDLPLPKLPPRPTLDPDQRKESRPQVIIDPIHQSSIPEPRPAVDSAPSANVQTPHLHSLSNSSSGDVIGVLQRGSLEEKTESSSRDPISYERPGLEENVDSSCRDAVSYEHSDSGNP
jgi:hypothetical protein